MSKSILIQIFALILVIFSNFRPNFRSKAFSHLLFYSKLTQIDRQTLSVSYLNIVDGTYVSVTKLTFYYVHKVSSIETGFLT